MVKKDPGIYQECRMNPEDEEDDSESRKPGRESRCCNLLMFQLALLIIIALSTAVTFFLFYRELTFQRSLIDGQVRNLTEKIHELSRDVGSFANGEYVEFFGEGPKNKMSRAAEFVVDTNGVRRPHKKRTHMEYLRDKKDEEVLEKLLQNDKPVVPHVPVGSTGVENVVHGDTEEHVWLTSHSRIPLYVLREFFQATSAHCVKDLESMLSKPEIAKRLKGDKGDRGPQGHCSCAGSTMRRHAIGSESVLMGSRGPPGPRGAKGDRGPPGPPGVCAIKCLDENVLPRSYPSSANLLTSHQQRTGLDEAENAKKPMLIPTTVNPYLASYTTSTTTKSPYEAEAPIDIHSAEIELPEPPRMWEEKDHTPTTEVTTEMTTEALTEPTVVEIEAELTSTAVPYYTPDLSLTQPVSLEYSQTTQGVPTDQVAPQPTPHYESVQEPEEQPLPYAEISPVPSRKRTCFIEAIGKPVLLRSPPETDHTTAWGAIMRDAVPPSVVDAPKYYVTEQFTGKELLEYANADYFKAFQPTFKYSLPKPFRGVSHVVYNGSFYYHIDNQPAIAKFDLADERLSVKKVIAGISHKDDRYIYNLDNNYAYMDFAVDEHGLWLIYTTDLSTNTMVSFVDPESLDFLFTRNISFSHTGMGNGFVACGVFYGISTVHTPYSEIVLAYDLLNDQYYDLPKEAYFTNPRRRSVMVDYNPRDRKLYSWDGGWQLMFPLKFTSLFP